MGWSGQDDGRSREALLGAWELGLTHWDTADVYGDGHAEELIGSLWERVPRRRSSWPAKWAGTRAVTTTTTTRT